jgi:hypothetical protein
VLITLVAILCNGPLCLEKVVTTSEQSGKRANWYCRVPRKRSVSRVEAKKLQARHGKLRWGGSRSLASTSNANGMSVP